MGTLEKKGTPVPTNVIWIAAMAAREDVLVLTSDGHFRQIERVGVELLE